MEEENNKIETPVEINNENKVATPNLSAVYSAVNQAQNVAAEEQVVVKPVQISNTVNEEFKTETKEDKKEEKKKEKKKNNWWKPVALIVLIIIIILLLLTKCSKGKNDDNKKYKIKIHNGDEIIEVDSDFKLSDFEVDGGTIGFLVDSDLNVVDPSKDLDPEKEYSVHIIPEGKEKVKVTYVNGDNSFTVEYQKGAGLLFPENPTKDGYVFIGWKDEDIDDYPLYMSPVNKDMTLVAQFEKTLSEGGKCTLNCDTNKDGKCDINCDTDSDGKPDKNIDENHDLKCDLNCDINDDGRCDLNCDTNGDDVADTNMDTNGDLKCDLNCDENHISKCNNTNCNEEDLDTIYDSKTISVDCTSNAIYIFMAKSTIMLSVTIDGEEVKILETNENANEYQRYIKYDLSSYQGSGKEIDMIGKAIKVDDAGQKYFKIKTWHLVFEGNCNTEIQEPTIEPKPTDPDNPTNPEPTPEPTPNVTYSCPDGYQLSGDKCLNNVTISKEAEVIGYSCQGGFTYKESDGRCHKEEDQGCPAGYDNGPNGCERLVTANLQCGSPYHVCGNECCEEDGTVTRRETPRCPDGYYLSNSGDKCETYLYDVQRGCYNANSTEIPGSFKCDTVSTATPQYSCSKYGNDYNLNGEYCVKTYTEIKDAIKN